MSNTQIIPTDRYGNVYYGPTTFRGAEFQIDDGRPADEMADIMEDAGYPRIAARIRIRHGISKPESVR